MAAPGDGQRRRPSIAMSEFDIIRRLQEIICVPAEAFPLACVLGIGDDGAILDVPAGRQLVVCTDTLVEGVHFPRGTAAAAVGHKALAVNLSDLAAMGADPAWFFMALTLPAADHDWLDSFAKGMAELAGKSGIFLAGGDVSCGNLSITITALGLVDEGQALSRAGAQEGDLVVVSGTPGAAANALNALQAGESPESTDLAALEYPVPRLSLGRQLSGLATSCIDISDGLLADLGHLIEQSGGGAEIELAKLPCPAGLRNLPAPDRWPMQLAGGDDYELCFTVPPSSAQRLEAVSGANGVKLTAIGTVTDCPGLVLRMPDGGSYEPDRTGYLHFNDSGRLADG